MSDLKLGTEVQVIKPFKVFRKLLDGSYDVCDLDGNCLNVKVNEIILKTKNQSEMKAMKNAVLTTARQLCKANNTVTTLEVKTELRRDYPYYFWDQATVSNYMSQLAGDGLFTYTDNGTYRTYSLANTKKTLLGKVARKKVVTSQPNKKTTSNTIPRNSVLGFAVSPTFESVTLSSGKTVDKYAIRGQKKSPLGYITPKLHNVVSITAGGTTYLVK